MNLPSAAHRENLRTTRKNFPARQRSAPMGRLVALGQTRSHLQIQLRRPGRWAWRDHVMGRKKKVGAGRMTITDNRPSDLIRFKLEFFRPFAATNIAEFRFVPDGAQTDVKWTMTGKTNTFFKVFSLFMNCEKMCGKDFAKGLASLTSIVEK